MGEEGTSHLRSGRSLPRQKDTIPLSPRASHENQDLGWGGHFPLAGTLSGLDLLIGIDQGQDAETRRI
jgi:hypothetical protein